MTIKIQQKKNKLIIKTKEATNNSLTNKELLKKAINHVNQKTNKIIIKSDYLIKEYSAELLKGLKNLKTKDPIKDYLKGKKKLKNTPIIKKAEKLMKKGMTSSEVYNKLLVPEIKPLFIKSIINPKPQGFNKVKEYRIGESEISINKKGNQFFYHVKPSELTISYENIKKVINTLKEINSKELSLNQLKKEVIELINNQEVRKEIKQIIKRHSIGFGIIDIIFNDENIQDIYFYSSGKNLHVTHAKYGDCDTNIKLTKKEIESIATKIRVASGRPFDDSFPVIDYELEDYNLRICGVREPLTFKGTGYAFRKHRKIPWTLSSFIEKKMINSEIAGLLNFLVDGQCSILITGPRGSGKTSLLSALINEVPINQRIIIIEDTPELPVNQLSNAGFRIQHLRIKTPLKKRSTSYELSAEEALRTALRLGESVLVIGEVRGEEAKALFEAMRIGAAGNVVLGTIHGSTVYDTYDRIVNDLKVPPTSFKSTDIIISCANLRRGESLFTDRRVVNITEVKKKWTNKPIFNELTEFNRETKKLQLSPEIKNSVILNKIAKLKGMTINQCLKSIKKRGKAKELLIKQEIKKKPRIIAEYNNKLIELLNKKKKNIIPELKKYLNSVKQDR